MKLLQHIEYKLNPKYDNDVFTWAQIKKALPLSVNTEYSFIANNLQYRFTEGIITGSEVKEIAKIPQAHKLFILNIEKDNEEILNNDGVELMDGIVQFISSRD